LKQPNFAEQIRFYTKEEHARLEKKLVGIIRHIRTVDQYVAFLEMFYAFYRETEQKMEQYLTTDRIPDIQQRRKAAALLQDIQALDPFKKPGSYPAAAPSVNSYPRALGAAYVLEGSTLGGVHIAKMIREQVPDLPPGKGFSFFESYGPAVQEMWKKFHTYLNRLTDAAEQQEAITAARDTFLTFNHWANRYERVFQI
jgi:heme oxygenase